MTPFLPFGTKKRTHFTFNCFYLLYNSFLFFYHLPSNKNIAKFHGKISNAIVGQGWYRFAKLDLKTGNIDNVKGSLGYSLIFFLKTNYNTGGNQTDFVSFTNSYEKSYFTVLGASHSGNNITKFRHVIDETNKMVYLELYYNQTSSLGNTVKIEALSLEPNDGSRQWVLINPYEKTEESVEGTSVISSCDLVTKDRSVVTNSDLPIMESHLVDPNGSNTIKINLQNNTTVERVQVTLASLIDLQISGMTVRAGAYNTVEIILSKTYSGTIRVNVLYYKT